MDCNFCYSKEISKNPNGINYEPHVDKNVEKRICGSCTQKLLGMKISVIPWEGIILENKTDSEKPILKKRRKH